MSRLRAFAEIVRLPALPTALADIGLGALVTRSFPDRLATVGCLLFSTACLYSAGMAWNDFFDAEKDRRERPERPIPSGRIRRREAGRLAAVFMLGGVVCGFLADLSRSRDEAFPEWTSTILAISLAAAILAYDGWLKKTLLGPVAMGTCRFLNVLLGVSVGGSMAWPIGPHLALVVGVYIVGVTWFARTEARTSNRVMLRAAAGCILLALGLALTVPLQAPEGTTTVFPYLLVVFGFAMGLPIARAIDRPTPEVVQVAVRDCLSGLIVLDALLASALVGIFGLVLLVLLVPSIYLQRRRWLYMT